MTIADMVSAIADLVSDTGLLPVAFVGAIVSGAALLLRRAIRAAR
jgi:hypothetical protein